MTRRLELHEDFKTVDGDTATVSVDGSSISINIHDGSGGELRHVQRISLDLADLRTVISILNLYDQLEATLKGEVR